MLSALPVGEGIGEPAQQAANLVGVEERVEERAARGNILLEAGDLLVRQHRQRPQQRLSCRPVRADLDS
jgi:hypothetical protein